MNSLEKVGKTSKFRSILVALFLNLEIRKTFRAQIPNESRGLNRVFPTTTTMASGAALLGQNRKFCYETLHAVGSFYM
jgi:hypothetical protein